MNLSIYWLKWVKTQKGLKPPEKAVLVWIADYYNDEIGCAWPSQETLAEDTGYNRSTIHRACKSLQEKGLLSWEKQMRSSGHFSSNRYKLHRVSDSHTAESLKAEKEAIMLQTAESPCVTHQQEPLLKPLILPLKLEQHSKKDIELTRKQLELAELWAGKLVSKHPGEYFDIHQIINDCKRFISSDQSEESWRAIGNGLPNPKKL